ncbi:MAG: hypothetical protein ACRDCE_21525, partial [Cetobacterium sp.]|uniref:hypothetical protein n=1 Tax=Cetobacterium sp. TaxID=2071632 RepID=UPI003EE65242
MKIDKIANELLKQILQMNFTNARVDYYKVEIRKVGLYEGEIEKEEYLESLGRKAEREHKRNLEKKRELIMMEKFVLEKIDNAFKGEIDKEAVKEKLNTGDVIEILNKLEYYEGGLIQDVKGDLIEYIKEELRELEFPEGLSGFDYEIKYSS